MCKTEQAILPSIATKPPTVEQLAELLHTISHRVASFLERRGLLERDEDNSYLTLDGLDEDPKPDLPPGSVRVAKLAGFSLHAGVAAKAHR